MKGLMGNITYDGYKNITDFLNFFFRKKFFGVKIVLNVF